MSKEALYQQVRNGLVSLLDGERDEIATMSTMACELFHAFDSFDWVGFYRVVSPELLKVGPYQGGHGCVTIPFARGVCGKCAREGTTQLVPDVNALPHHIACSSETRSEIVVPVFDGAGNVRAVLDVDSNQLDAFDKIDQQHLQAVACMLQSIDWLRA